MKIDREKYNQIIDEAYKNYMNNWPSKIPRIGPCLREEFINQCKTDDEFAKTWGLKIDEKEINVYHIPKTSIEYIETKFIVLPTGDIENE
jgi:hypothetical protein